MTNNAPEGVNMGGSLASMLNYIAEREESLAKYSDKLRENVIKIFELFGDPRYCRVCGRHADNHPHEGAPYATVVLDETHAFKPKILASLRVDDSVVFLHDDTEDAMPEDGLILVMSGGELAIDSQTFDGEVYRQRRKNPKDLSREALKALVKSGRITAFIHEYAEKLDQTTEEYRMVAEIAERMAQAIP